MNKNQKVMVLFALLVVFVQSGRIPQEGMDRMSELEAPDMTDLEMIEEGGFVSDKLRELSLQLVPTQQVSSGEEFLAQGADSMGAVD